MCRREAGSLVGAFRVKSTTFTSSRCLKVLLWIARGSAGLFILFVAFFVLGSAFEPQGLAMTTHRAIMFAFFPIGMCVGYALGWRWPFLGGALGIICLLVFLILMGEADFGLFLPMSIIPAILLILYGILHRRSVTAAQPDLDK
jgi:hypothetical protein